MQCPFCHWSTRDLGIPDAPTAGSWPEKENLNQVIIGEKQPKIKIIVKMTKNCQRMAKNSRKWPKTAIISQKTRRILSKIIKKLQKNRENSKKLAQKK